MNLSPQLFGLAIGLMWLGPIASTDTRNWRFVGFLGAVSILALNLAFFGGAGGRGVAIAVLGVGLVALVWPVRFHLSSTTEEDRAADRVLRSMEQALDESQDNFPVPPELTEPPFADEIGSWANAGRLYRLYLARLGDPDPNQLRPGVTLTWGYRRAARHYWHAALRRHVIGRHSLPSEWDEEVLLRCFSEEFDRMIPADALRARAIVPRQLAQAAERLVDDLASTPFRFPESMRRQRLLVEARRTALAIALGDRSEGAIDVANAAAAAVLAGWSALGEADAPEG